jgi:hypothetical protein
MGEMNMAKIAEASALMVALVFAIGCDSQSDENKVGSEKKGAKHEHKPPHGGTLVEFGEEFAHLELQLDPAIGRLTGYVLDGEAEKPVPIVQGEIVLLVKGKSADYSVPLKGVGNPLTGEKLGDTSQFEGQADQLKGAKEFDAEVLKITVKGKEFSKVSFNFPKGNEEK